MTGAEIMKSVIEQVNTGARDALYETFGWPKAKAAKKPKTAQ
jgi:hypothetical protein